MSKAIADGKHRTPRCALILSLALLLCAAAGPAGAAGSGQATGTGRATELAAPENTSYLNTDLAKRLAGGAACAGTLRGGMPEEYCPKTVRAERKASPGAPAPAGEVRQEVNEGSGTGGWTTMSRPFSPSPAAGVNYGSGWSEIDSAGRLHLFYERYVETDISEPPDAAGFRIEYTARIYYTVFSEGAWTEPVMFTDVSGKWSSALVMIDFDPAGNLHVIYTTYEWSRDHTRPAGEYGAYHHRNENLTYRYRDAAGDWNPTRRLSDYSGNWELLSADTAMQGGAIHCAWVAVRNNQTVPSSYRAQVAHRSGFESSWDSRNVIEAWDFNNDPGQLVPDYWLSVGASGSGGETTAVYMKRRIGGALFTSRCDVWATTLAPPGEWSAPARITGAPDNYMFVAAFVSYPAAGDRAVVFCYRAAISEDATHPPRVDFYFVCRESGEWKSPENLTAAAANQAAAGLSINAGPFGDFSVTYVLWTIAYNGATWEKTGSTVKNVRETQSGIHGRLTIMPYMNDRHVEWLDAALDGNGATRVAYATYVQGAGDPHDYSVYYTDDTVSGADGAFQSPVEIRPDTSSEITDTLLSVLPAGDVLVTWFEERYDPGTGAPLVCRVCSRLKSGGEWGPRVTVSEVPGSDDKVHGGLTHRYFDFYTSSVGEKQCVFETAKYNPGTHTYHDCRKYWSQTVSGKWSEPERVPASDFAGRYPFLCDDGNQRSIAVCDGVDPATGKMVVYASVQKDPSPPGNVYFFAEGTTRDGFEEWICVQNPGETPADVTITYMLENGENPRQMVVVAPHSRSTVDVRAFVGPGHDVSARVESNVWIIAERPMYFDYRGWTGGHDSVGALETSRLWYFAEGTTRAGFSEYLTIQNPDERAADVTVTYVLDDGTTREQVVEVRPGSRATVDVNAAVGPDRDVSMVVECPDVAIVAERPMYFSYGALAWTGGHDVMGSTALSSTWYFAEGTTRGGFDTYLCVQNPGAHDAEVAFTFIFGDGATAEHSMTVPATSRRTLKVNDVTGPDRDVSVKVQSSARVLIERPMYFDYHGAWTGGHVAVGSRAQKRAWYLAEGTTRDGFDEWICIENPGSVDATAAMSYMLEDGTVVRRDVPVLAHTRVTVDVRAAVGSGRDVSTLVWSDLGVIVERPMYFNYHGVWTGGHDVVGL